MLPVCQISHRKQHVRLFWHADGSGALTAELLVLNSDQLNSNIFSYSNRKQFLLQMCLWLISPEAPKTYRLLEKISPIKDFCRQPLLG